MTKRESRKQRSNLPAMQRSQLESTTDYKQLYAYKTKQQRLPVNGQPLFNLFLS
ncbi:hypothetical protein [Porphyromonas pogonae]|uniref:hypothetical protein n=1 Tax=Porphyromonas pogonae TaxID=867595 RepID=UPI002E7A5043|nr:hypothetical protein [Porphyromonas pogonae]